MTRTSARARATSGIVSVFIPPSTEIKKPSRRSARDAAREAHFSRQVGMNAWPPKPGSTVMTSTRSTKGKISYSEETGVEGTMAIPGFAPMERMDRASRWA